MEPLGTEETVGGSISVIEEEDIKEENIRLNAEKDSPSGVDGEYVSSDTNEEDVPCPCGDETHVNLGKWYERYLQDPKRAIKSFEEDEFNEIAVENAIQKMLPQVPVSMGYCSSCQRLLDNCPEIVKKVSHDDYHYYEPPYFENTLEFEAGFRNKCRLCSLWVQESPLTFSVWHQIHNRLSCLGKSTHIKCFLRAWRYGGCGDFSVRVELLWPGHGKERSEFVHRYIGFGNLYCVKSSDNKLFNLMSPLTDELSSPLNLAKKWLYACLNSHPYCKSTANGDYPLPTRLIDVGSIPAHLVSTSDFTTTDFTTKPAYATLSHCWGEEKFLVLQQDSLEKFMIAIPEDELTKTFRDAIHITRSLGLRFLWIDSLCIIQKSETDWLREAPLMASVYSGSTINIAAAGAENGTKGCFLKPNLKGFVDKVRIRLTENEIWDLAPERYYEAMVKSPLSKRAWCLQERLLSPRILYFTKSELYWECQYCQASETWPEGLPDYERSDYHTPDRTCLSKTWDKIVGLYTGSNLTYQTDKLIAISGIAQRVQKESQDQYLAGLWRKDIEKQLLWQKLYSCQRSGCKAPSWSWASMDGEVYYSMRGEGNDYVYYAHVIESHISPQESFGYSITGELHMSCSILLVWEVRKLYIDGWDNAEMEIVTPGAEQERIKIYLDLWKESQDYQDACLLPILDVLETPASNRTTKGLVLFPTGGKKGQHTRAGIFQLFPNVDVERFLPLLEQFTSSGKAVAETDYAEILENPETPDERYVITII